MWSLVVYSMFALLQVYGHPRHSPAELRDGRNSLRPDSMEKVSSFISCDADTEIEVSPGESVILESPNFGTDESYPHNLNCLTIFRGHCKLNFTCEHFHLNDQLCYDSLEVSDSAGSGRYCGSTAPVNVTTENYLAVRFRTNAFKNLPGYGFSCSVKCVDLGSHEDSVEEMRGASFVKSDPETGFDCNCGEAATARKIVNGTQTLVNEYPWMAAIVRTGESQPICGGSLVNNLYVLTAAHCVEDIKSPQIQIILKEFDTGMETESVTIVRDVESILIHPDYTYYKDFDAALIKLKQSVILGRDKPKLWNVCLPQPAHQGAHLEGMSVRVTGWGRLSTTGPQSSTLQQVDLKVVKDEHCKNFYPVLTPRMMCAAGKGKDTCKGDSGGPLMVDLNGGTFTQVGIVSAGSVNGCATDAPGIYTKVTEIVPWINENTADGKACTGSRNDPDNRLKVKPH